MSEAFREERTDVYDHRYEQEAEWMYWWDDWHGSWG